MHYLAHDLVEGLTDVDATLTRRLDVAYLVLVSEGHSLSLCHCPVFLHIEFVADEDDLFRTRSTFVGSFSHPHGHGLKALTVGDIVKYHIRVYIPVEARCDASEALLACSVPDLKLHSFPGPKFHDPHFDYHMKRHLHSTPMVVSRFSSYESSLRVKVLRRTSA